MIVRRLPRSFFDRPVVEVARDLLGGHVEGRGVRIRVTEVEAYAGRTDAAAHSFRGPTRRSAVMFGPPGHLYVYFTYGMHWCVNLVCGREGVASAVLLRAGAVVGGLDVARARTPSPLTERRLASGPARLARVLGLSGADSGLDLCTADSPLRVRPYRGVIGGGTRPAPDTAPGTGADQGCPDDHDAPQSAGQRSGGAGSTSLADDGRIRCGPRVGVTGAADWPWRFWIADEPTVTAYRTALPRRPRR
ncbi:MAG: DNA-3-methyladenine glycosylase [Mycobacteriales bacterium]